MPTEDEKRFFMHIQEMEGMVKSEDSKKYIRELATTVQEEITKFEEYVPYEVRIAEYLHEKLCRGNHTDGCAWLYEKWDDAYFVKDGKLYASKSMGTKAGYLRKAMEIVKRFKEKNIIIQGADDQEYCFNFRRVSVDGIFEIIKLVME